ncbi:MAG: CDP-diacylglycerol--serine O-phosphatidyltransferase [Rhodospirillaceae bacterium TMED8]|nr:CDP-diacylglycerol--serine O-phosphatidyltransferase [Magnetovibrio sp.]OUT50772.1 MAG: CDP-diacylglycerol--serine O-phosphatidyltransferase [Rhodospirillaceae bacterium TMED8]
MSESPKKRRRLKHLSVNVMIPNILTLLALASGLTGIRFAIEEHWEEAVMAIAVAAVFDALDGRIARLLKGSSKFGAELDSLSDFVCFGVAPAMILYLWGMQDGGRVGWLLVMLFAMCCGLRLARFNVALEDDNAPSWKSNFFSGIPAPAGAGLVLVPMILTFQIDTNIFRSPWVVSVFLLGIGAFFVSSIPTYSMKKLRVPQRKLLVTMLGVAMIIAFVASFPWLSLTIFLTIYMISIPFSVRSYRRYAAGGNMDDDIDEDDAEELEPI